MKIERFKGQLLTQERVNIAACDPRQPSLTIWARVAAKLRVLSTADRNTAFQFEQLIISIFLTDQVCGSVFQIY